METIEILTYGKSKPPSLKKLQNSILAILNRKVNGELPFIRATDLRRRVCSKVKAPSFFALLRQMETEQLIMISGIDETWAQCALWDHPRMIEWRIEREKWAKELEEIERRDAEERRQRERANAPRLARERFQKALAEFFVDNSDELLEVLGNMMRAFRPMKRPWLHSILHDEAARKHSSPGWILPRCKQQWL